MKDGTSSGVTRRTMGGVVAFVGFLLSPLSWWNDLFINIPLALAFGWMTSFFYPSAFQASVIVGYWLTNLAGLLMMHWGAAAAFEREATSLNRKKVAIDMGIALGYTVLLIVLIKLKVFGPVPRDFLGGS